MTRQSITVLLLWLFPLLSVAGETLRGNSVLGGVKDDVASCFVADGVMKSSMRTVSLGVKTGKAMSLAPFGERGDGLVRSVVVSERQPSQEWSRLCSAHHPQGPQGRRAPDTGEL